MSSFYDYCPTCRKRTSVIRDLASNFNLCKKCGKHSKRTILPQMKLEKRFTGWVRRTL